MGSAAPDYDSVRYAQPLETVFDVSLVAEREMESAERLSSFPPSDLGRFRLVHRTDADCSQAVDGVEPGLELTPAD